MFKSVLISMVAFVPILSTQLASAENQEKSRLAAASAQGQVIELVAIVRMDKTLRTVWTPEGSLIDSSEKWGVITQARTQKPTHGFVFRCQGFQKGQDMGWGELALGMVTPILNDNVPEFVTISKTIPEGSTTKIQVGILGEWGPWQRIDPEGQPEDSKPVPKELKPLYQLVKGAEIRGGGETTRTTLKTGFGLKGVVGNKQFEGRGEWEVVIVDGEGKRHDRRGVGLWNGGPIQYFDLAKDDISHFEYRLRPYLEWMTFENIPLESGTDSKAKVTTDAVDLSKIK